MMTSEIEQLLAEFSLLEAELISTRNRLTAAEKRITDTTRSRDADFYHRSQIFDVVLSNIPDLLCMFDLGGCFTYANLALLDVWRKSLSEIIGKNTFDLGYPPELATRIQQEVTNVITTRRPVRNLTPFTGRLGRLASTSTSSRLF
jgi:PAS domain-containing protein